MQVTGAVRLRQEVRNSPNSVEHHRIGSKVRTQASHRRPAPEPVPVQPVEHSPNREKRAHHRRPPRQKLRPLRRSAEGAQGAAPPPLLNTIPTAGKRATEGAACRRAQSRHVHSRRTGHMKAGKATLKRPTLLSSSDCKVRLTALRNTSAPGRRPGHTLYSRSSTKTWSHKRPS